MNWIQRFDWAILRALQAIRNPVLDGIVPFITFLGDAGWIWIAIGIALLCYRPYRKQGILLLAGLLLGLLLGNVLLKNLVARARPCWLDPNVLLLIDLPQDYSFPSGHTLSSFIAATVLSKTNRKIAIGAWILASLIALSRLYLFVHFPTDVLFGAILGIGIGSFVLWGGNRLFCKKIEKTY